MSRIIERTNDSYLAIDVDAECKNEFRWEWLETVIDLDGIRVALSQFIRKIDSPGKCKCILCEKTISYGSRGRVALVEHCQSAEHGRNLKTTSSNQKLPASFTWKVENSENKSYGMHPFFKNVKIPEVPVETNPCVSFENRVASAQALVLSVIAEHSLPLTMAPVLIGLAQELSQTNMYWMSCQWTEHPHLTNSRGLAKTVKIKLIDLMRSNKFSLNLDETTSSNNKHIVTVLVNIFSGQENRVILEHLTTTELISVNSEVLFDILLDEFEANDVPWTNLVSVLMDSCSVMRGCKNGQETRIRREKAPHLIDIDGDICHHMHNGSKKFCELFHSWIEHLFHLLHTDFADLKEALSELCHILGVRFTGPERFLSHRWLSAYDVSVSTLRLWGAYKIFYYAFIDKSMKESYWPVVVQIFSKRSVDSPGRACVKEIINTIRKKNMTADEKKRKQEIVEKVIINVTYLINFCIF